MSNENQPSGHKVPQPWQPRFGIGGLLLVMLVFCVMAAAAYYFVQAIRGGDRSFHLAFILFTLASPLLLLVVVSVLRGLALRIDRWSRRL